MTQSSSKPRVKEDGIGEDVMRKLYESYEITGIDDYRILCKDAINLSNGKAATKEIFYMELDRAKSKSVMLTKITNYFLAGEGKGV